jgi:hypothetical protein
MDTHILLRLLAATTELFGGLMVAYAALRVHHRFLNEHKVDENVFSAMKREQKLAVGGAVLLVVGYILTIYTEFIWIV